MSNTPQNKTNSHFSIGGIHSLPVQSEGDSGNVSTVQTAIIDNQYGPGTGGDLIAPAVSAIKPAAEEIVRPSHSRVSPPHTGERAGDKKEAGVIRHRNDWSCRIRCNKYGLSGSYLVLILLGEVPDDPEQWLTCPSFVGMHAAYVGSGECTDGSKFQIQGIVHLNMAIAERSGLSSYEPSVVVPYLQNCLHWRVQEVNGPVVEPSRYPSLEVTVLSTPMTRLPGSDFPTFGEPQYHHYITFGRPGGARQV